MKRPPTQVRRHCENDHTTIYYHLLPSTTRNGYKFSVIDPVQLPSKLQRHSQKENYLSISEIQKA